MSLAALPVWRAFLQLKIFIKAVRLLPGCFDLIFFHKANLYI